MIWRPPRSTQSRSSAASDVYKRQIRQGSDWPKPAAELPEGTLDKVGCVQADPDRGRQIEHRQKRVEVPLKATDQAWMPSPPGPSEAPIGGHGGTLGRRPI